MECVEEASYIPGAKDLAHGDSQLDFASCF